MKTFVMALLEAPCASNEYQQQIFSWRNKKHIEFIAITQLCETYTVALVKAHFGTKTA